MATISSLEEIVKFEKPKATQGQNAMVDSLKNNFLYGPNGIKQNHYGCHPLEKMEKTRLAREEYLDMSILRSVQGVHAPLRLLAERKAARQIGRLPFLPSSNLMMDVLTGHDDMILPENIFDLPNEFCEVQLPPHMTVERSLNIL